MFLIQDGRTVFNRVVKPAVIFDLSTGTLHKIGEFDTLFVIHQNMCARYAQCGFTEEVENLILTEIPHDQEIIDKIFNITGYIKTLYLKSIK